MIKNIETRSLQTHVIACDNWPTTGDKTMNAYTDNTHELIKVFFFSDFMRLPLNDFAKIVIGTSQGRYELIVIDEENW